MKQYVFDQLRESDHDLINEFLHKNADKTMMSEIFWVNLPEDLYTPVQKEHSKCHPFYFAVNLSKNSVAFEFLIRSRQILRCNCIAYATPAQRDYIMEFGDRMLEDLKIKL
ncbi:MAG: hypothetical protein GX433_00625 [Deltaproteobacteria bacterium]|nr:hypothetical protein [Deltaproteobacteria bacterium]